jgi:hypothetical protein
MRWILFAMLGSTFAFGNDTAVNAAGHAPEPLGAIKGEESVIRMVSEKIDIVFGKEKSKVHCRFVFHSTKPDADAKQTVGFPDMVGDADHGKILSMITRIDGKEVPSKLQEGYFNHGDSRSIIGKPPREDTMVTEAKFHTVEVTFPPDKDVIIEREYVVDNGGSVMGDSTFSYTTKTGAIWHGTIGKAEFTVTLDGWTIDDLAFEDGPQKLPPRQQMNFCSVNKADWKIESPTKLSLVWENFEPAVHQSRQGIFLTTWNRNR